MRKEKIKVYIKYSDRGLEIAEIANNLETMQTIVGGYIETVTIGDVVAICDEDGRLKGKPYNCNWNGHELVGTVVFCGVDGDEFTDHPAFANNSKDTITLTEDEAAEICDRCHYPYVVHDEDVMVMLCKKCPLNGGRTDEAH